MTSYDNEENAVVVNEGGISETPSNLVNDNLDLETEQPKLDEKLKYKKDGNVDESKLSPNPAGFGFTKQVFVDSLPNSNQEVDTLYLLAVKNGGEVIGYKKYKWTKIDGFVFCGVTPDLRLENGPRETPVHENNAPKKAPEKVFTGPVAFNDDIYYKGKKLPENDEVGSIVKANPTLAGTETELTGLDIDGTKYKVPQPIDVVANPTLAGTESDLEGLEVGSSKYAVPPRVSANPTLDGTEAALTGLQIGNTKYKAGGGTQKYLHSLDISVPFVDIRFYLTIISSSATKIDTIAALVAAVASAYTTEELVSGNMLYISQSNKISISNNGNITNITTPRLIIDITNSDYIRIDRSFNTYTPSVDGTSLTYAVAYTTQISDLYSSLVRIDDKVYSL